MISPTPPHHGLKGPLCKKLKDLCYGLLKFYDFMWFLGFFFSEKDKEKDQN